MNSMDYRLISDSSLVEHLEIKDGAPLSTTLCEKSIELQMNPAGEPI
jgi:hypothetical protein